MRATIWRLVVVAAVAAFAAGRMYSQSTASDVVTGVIAALGAYALAVVVVYGIAVLSYQGLWIWVGLAAVAGCAGGFLSAGGDQWVDVVLTVAGTVSAGALVGGLIQRRTRPFHAFAAAAIVLTAITLIFFLPHWPELRAMSVKSSEGLVEQFGSSMTLSGYSAEMQENYRKALQDGLDLVIRLTPASTVLSGLLQLALGYLWFNFWMRRHEGKVIAEPFMLWKVPFTLMPVVIVLASMRLLGGEGIQEIADNGLAVTALFYCFAGLALIEFTIRRLQVGMFMRIMFYVMLFLTQIIGFLLVSLLGFIDSFADWRKIAAAKIALKS
ncbi:MAG: DUF2232 domain-containing protein [Candidatus Zixiibacteriota bacterium]